MNTRRTLKQIKESRTCYDFSTINQDPQRHACKDSHFGAWEHWAHYVCSSKIFILWLQKPNFFLQAYRCVVYLHKAKVNFPQSLVNISVCMWDKKRQRHAQKWIVFLGQNFVFLSVMYNTSYYSTKLTGMQRTSICSCVKINFFLKLSNIIFGSSKIKGSDTLRVENGVELLAFS